MARLAWIATFTGSLLLWGVHAQAQGGDGVSDGRVALFPVQYEVRDGEPLVGAHMPDVGSGLRRIWTGEVLTEGSLAEAMRLTWVAPGDVGVLEKLQKDVDKAEERFLAGSPAEAIPLLEKIVRGADTAMPHVSADPDRAELLLKGHLFLWWALSLEGEKGRLEALMAKTAARFPAAVVDTSKMPPDVAQAFAIARTRLATVAVTVELNAAGAEGCQILVGGFQLGDGRSAAVGLPPGKPYNIAGRCGEKVLARRVQVEGPQVVRLDMVLASALTETSAGPTIQLVDGPDEVSGMVRISRAIGRALGSGEVILVGVHGGGRSGRVMQFDRIRLGDQKPVRQCSVRLGMVEALDRADIDQALRVVKRCQPFAEAVDLEVAVSDNIYRNREEFVEFVAQDGSYVLTWLSAGVSGAALTTAVLMEFVGIAAQQDLDDCVANTACRGTSEAEGLRNDLNDFLVTRDTLYVVGGAAALGAVALYFLETPSAEDVLGAEQKAAAQWRWTPWVGAGAAGVGLTVPLD